MSSGEAGKVFYLQRPSNVFLLTEESEELWLRNFYFPYKLATVFFDIDGDKCADDVYLKVSWIFPERRCFNDLKLTLKRLTSLRQCQDYPEGQSFPTCVRKGIIKHLLEKCNCRNVAMEVNAL